MKNKFLVGMLLLVSIVLQSFASIASPIESHKDDVEHLQTVHIHTNDNIDQETDQDGHSIKDCHHCGHCSGSHSMWVLSKFIAKIAHVHSLESSPYLVSSTSKYIETTFRPPTFYLI